MVLFFIWFTYYILYFNTNNEDTTGVSPKKKMGILEIRTAGSLMIWDNCNNIIYNNCNDALGDEFCGKKLICYIILRMGEWHGLGWSLSRCVL